MKKNKNTSNSVRKLVLTALVATPVALIPTTLNAVSAATGVTGTNLGASSSISYNYVSGTKTGTITASADKTILLWNSFGDGSAAGNDYSIASGETLNFVLPSTTSSVLNRVITASATTIDGTVTSNGKFYLINPTGITVTKNGLIGAPTIVLTTSDENDGGTLTTASAGDVSKYAYFRNYGDLRQIVDKIFVAGTADVVIQSSGGVSAKLQTPNASGTGDVYLVGSNVKAAGIVNGSLFIAATGTVANGTVTLGQDSGTGGVTDDSNDGGLLVTKNLEIVAKTGAGTVDLNSALTNGATSTSKAIVNVQGTTKVTAYGSVAVGLADTSKAGSFDAVTGTGAGSSITITAASSADVGQTVFLKGDIGTATITRGGNVTIVDTLTTVGTSESKLAIGASKIDGNLTIDASADITANKAVVTTDVITFTTANSSVKINAGGAVADTAAVGNTLKVSGSVSIDQLDTANTKATWTITGDNDITLNDATVTGNGLSVKSTGAAATIKQAAGVAIANTGDVTLNAYKITLGEANTLASGGKLKLTVGGGGATIKNGATVLGASTATGDVVLTTAALALGSATSDVINFGGALTLNAGGSITDAADGIIVSGALAINTSGAGTSVTIDNAGHQFGQISGNLAGTTAGTANVITESTTLRVNGLVSDANNALTLTSSAGDVILQNIKTSTAALTVNAAKGNISQGSSSTDIIDAGGAVNLTALTTGSINLSNEYNKINGGLVTIADSVASLDVKNTLATSVTVAADKSVTGTTNITSTGAVTLGGSFKTLNVASKAGITATSSIVNTTFNATNETTGNISISGKLGTVTAVNSSTGNVGITDTDGAMTVKGLSSQGTLSVTGKTTVSFEGANYSKGNLTITSPDAITDATGATIITDGNLAISGEKGFTLDNAGNKVAGTLTITKVGANASSAVSGKIVLTGDVSLGNVTVIGDSSFALETTGDIAQATSTKITATDSTTGLLSFSGKNVTIDKDTSSGNNSAKAYAITATGNAILKQSTSALKLGNLIVGGDLTIDTSAESLMREISQVADSRIGLSGALSVTTYNAAITLTNKNNNFGGITALVNGPTGTGMGTADIAITEFNTVNLKNVRTQGNLVITSENQGIINTSNGTTEAIVIGSTKQATFDAQKENITVTSAKNELSKILFKASGDVKINSINQDVSLVKDSFSTAGGLDVNSNGKNITADTLSIYGQTNFTGAIITASSSDNKFGGLLIKSTGAVTIKESTDMSILAGSTFGGTTSLTSVNGGISTNGVGVINFNQTGADGTSAWDLTMTAKTSIVLNDIYVKGKSKFKADTLIDLSSLSIAGNFNGNEPTYDAGTSGTANKAK